ncbi:MAG: hypothetical protein AAB621_00120 [Patescibacteria group bacterium]
MTIVYILLGLIILILIRIFGICKGNSIELRKISPKIYFIYEQVLKEKTEKEKTSKTP